MLHVVAAVVVAAVVVAAVVTDAAVVVVDVVVVGLWIYQSLSRRSLARWLGGWWFGLTGVKSTVVVCSWGRSVVHSLVCWFDRHLFVSVNMFCAAFP